MRKLLEVSAYLRFPFTLDEAANDFLPKFSVTTAELRTLLDSEAFADLNFTVKDGYLLTSPDQSVVSRSEREKASAEKLQSATSFAKLLTRLVPFIKTVAVTGSVAYGSADKWDDVDLFVVTERNLLWVSTLLMLLEIRIYKALRLRAAHLLPFCLSYVHDERGFAKESKRNRTNALFARELLKAKPIAGIEQYREILEENNWVGEFYTDLYREKLRVLTPARNGKVRSREGKGGIVSFLLSWLDAWAYHFLSRYLRLRAYLTNLRLESEGNHLRAFEPIISRESCVYTSNFYRWLRELWGE